MRIYPILSRFTSHARAADFRAGHSLGLASIFCLLCLSAASSLAQYELQFQLTVPFEDENSGEGASISIADVNYSMTTAQSGGGTMMSPVLTAHLVPGTTYELVLATSYGIVAGTIVQLLNIDECVDYSFNFTYGVEPEHWSKVNDYTWENEDSAPVLTKWSITVDDDLGDIVFESDSCSGGLVADGNSVASAYYVPGSLSLGQPLSWSIVYPQLGCTLSLATNNGTTFAQIQGGTEPGTVTVRASSGSCYVESDLTISALGSDCQGGDGCSGNNFGESSFRTDTITGSMDARFHLGFDEQGSSLGYIKISSPSDPAAVTSAIYSRESLDVLFKSPKLQVDWDDPGEPYYIETISTTQGRISFEFIETHEYNIHYYHDAETSPFRTYTIDNPDESVAHRVRITDSQTGIAAIYSWTNNVWSLVIDGGASVEKALRSGGNSMRQIQSLTGMVLYSVTNSYSQVAANDRLISHTAGVGADARTDLFEHYSDGRLKQHSQWNGYWEHYLYDTNGLLTNLISAYLTQPPTNNPALARSMTYNYSTNAVPESGDAGTSRPDQPRLIAEYLLGEMVGMRYQIFGPYCVTNIVCLHTNLAWNNASNLVTITKSYPEGLFRGRIKSAEHPDGTMELYWYYHAQDAQGHALGYTTNIVLSGVPDGAKTNITSGTKSITILGAVGQLLSRTVTDIGSGYVVESVTNAEFDSLERPSKTTTLSGTSLLAYGCCGPTLETNEMGSITSKSYDSLKRLKTTDFNSITQSNVYDEAGNVLQRLRIANGTAITLQTNGFDTAGFNFARSDALGNRTVMAETLDSFGQLLRTTTALTNSSTGATKHEVFYLDGSLNTVTGSLVYPFRYEYGPTNQGRYVKQIKLDDAGDDTDEWDITFYDLANRPYKTLFPDGAFSAITYNALGQVASEADPDGVTTLFHYDARGQRNYVALDMDRDGNLDTNETDRVTYTDDEYYFNSSGRDYVRTRSYQWFDLDDDTSTLVREQYRSLDGLSSWTVDFETLTNRIDTTYVGAGSVYVTNRATDGSYTLSHSLNGQLLSSVRKNRNGDQISSKSFTYDSHGRNVEVIDARNGTNSFAFDDLDRVSSSTTPVPGSGLNAQTTGYAFNALGQNTAVTNADGSVLYQQFSDRGDLLLRYGSLTYPVQYAYDSQGRMTNMTTWKDYPISGDATTSWAYDSQRGFLTAKAYDDAGGTVSYEYTPAGRLYRRTWPRGDTTTYSTNAAGETISIDYSDPNTTDITFDLDRMGRATNIVDQAGSHQLHYSSAGLLLSATNTTGLLTGMGVTNAYDSVSFLRTKSTVLTNGPSSRLPVTFAYDSVSRLTNVTQGSFVFSYEYLANSSLLDTVTSRTAGSKKLQVEYTYDLLDRLTDIESSIGDPGTAAFAFSYSYNDLNQRYKVSDALGAYWLYGYDDLGQVESGRRHWPDGTPVAGQQFVYGFDDIGNREYTYQGGNDSGTQMRYASYTVNSLNQIESRDVPGAADIFGVAYAPAEVTVNDSASYRWREYFRNEVLMDNSAGPSYCAITNIATYGGSSETNTGNLLLPPSTEVFTYDANGNMTSDGIWTNHWDGENRLVLMETLPTVTNEEARYKLAFTYDAQGRRISKVVSNWVSGDWAFSYQRQFLYDGWNLVAEFDESNALVHQYVWGRDLSGSEQGAGGVGGLLMMTSSTDLPHYVAYDGNGNIAGLVHSLNATIEARYEYDPFGQKLRDFDDSDFPCPMGFSTKYGDPETGFLYYGHRLYQPSTGHWPSRDPIEQFIAPNHYHFAFNNPSDFVDIDGRQAFTSKTLRNFGLSRLAREIANAIVRPFLNQHIQFTETYDVDCPAGSAKRLLQTTTSEITRNVSVTVQDNADSGTFDLEGIKIKTLITEVYGCCKKKKCTIPPFYKTTTPWKFEEPKSSHKDITSFFPFTMYVGKDVSFYQFSVIEKTTTTKSSRSCLQGVQPTNQWLLHEACFGTWPFRTCVGSRTRSSW